MLIIYIYIYIYIYNVNNIRDILIRYHQRKLQPYDILITNKHDHNDETKKNSANIFPGTIY